MEDEKYFLAKNKGGRPRKEITRCHQLAVLCTPEERRNIEGKAKCLNVSISEFLRTIGLDSKATVKPKTLPSEVLLLTGTLNHLAANINQIAYKRNVDDQLNAIERAELNFLAQQIKALSEQIKTHLK